MPLSAVFLLHRDTGRSPDMEHRRASAHQGYTEACGGPGEAVVTNCCALMAAKQLLTVPLAQSLGETLLSYLLAMAPGTQALPVNAMSCRSNQTHVKTAGAAGISAWTRLILARAPTAVSSNHGRSSDNGPAAPLLLGSSASGAPWAACLREAATRPVGDSS